MTDSEAQFRCLGFGCFRGCRGGVQGGPILHEMLVLVCAVWKDLVGGFVEPSGLFGGPSRWEPGA